MSEDLEKRLDAFYRGLDDAARRAESRWKKEAPKASFRLLAWSLAAAAAAAAMIALAFLPRGGGEKALPPSPPSEARTPPDEPAPAPAPASPDRPAAPAPAPAPAPVGPPAPAPPPAEPPPPPAPAPEPAPPIPAPAPAPRPTVAERASIAFAETDGPFDLSDRPLRGRQKDIRVFAGDTFRAAGTAKLSLAPQRFILAAPQTVLSFRPGEKGLTLELEQGKLLVELLEAGPEVRVEAAGIEARPIGTVFAVQVENRRPSVLVEEGRVEVKGAGGGAVTLRAGQAIRAAENGALGAAAPADFRTLSWARAHRAAERTLFWEDFAAPGRWEADVRDGAARGLPAPGIAAQIHLDGGGHPLFEIPARGQVALAYRSDRVGKMVVQFFAQDLRVNYRREIQILRTPQWKALALDLDEFAPADRSKAPARIPPGTPVTDLLVAFETEGDKGSLWLDSFRVTGLR